MTERLWNRDFVLSTIAGFFSAMVLYSTMTTMAVFSAEKLGVSESMAGFVASIVMIGGVFGRLYSGRFLDRIGRRRITLLSAVLSAGMCLLYFIPAPLPVLLLICLAHGVILGVLHNSMAIFVIDFIPPARRAEGIGIFTLNFVLAIAFGPPLGIFLADRFSYNALWWANFGFALAALAIFAIVRIRKPVFTEEQRAQIYAKVRIRGFFEVSALPLAAMVFLQSLVYAAITAFLETYAMDLAVPAAASAFFLIYGLCVLASRPVAGRLIDRRGENFVMLPTILAYAVSLAFIALSGFTFSGFAPGFAAKTAMLCAAAVMMAAGYGAILPLGQAIAVKRVEPHQFGAATTTYFVFSDAGMGVGALILGAVAGGTGFAPMYLIGAVLVIVSLLLYWTLHGRKVRKHKEAR